MNKNERKYSELLDDELAATARLCELTRNFITARNSIEKKLEELQIISNKLNKMDGGTRIDFNSQMKVITNTINEVLTKIKPEMNNA